MKTVHIVIEFFTDRFNRGEDAPVKEYVISVHNTQKSALRKIQELQIKQLRQEIEVLEKDHCHSPYLSYRYVVAEKQFIED